MNSRAAAKDRLQPVFSSFRGVPDELIPLLHAIQREFGYLPDEILLRAARFLRVPESRIYSTALFYPQFRLKPVGRTHVCVCGGTACHVRGSRKILEKLERQFGIRAGETSGDLRYSLESIDCIGACGAAPNVIVNGKTYGGLTADDTSRILPKKRKSRGKK